MKRLVCEICDGTDFIKQDGVFVCQSCGTKYSVEDAKKMMSDVSDTPQNEVHTNSVTNNNSNNTSQIDNLLSLAKSSFSSQNFAKAEEFCNQVIMLDDKNFEAWKLKGEAINYQISADNPRFLEVFNCIMTSFRILDNAGKEEKKESIIKTIYDCIISEIDFWLKQFEAQRPTDNMYRKVTTSFSDLGTQLLSAIIEIDPKRNSLYTDFITHFIIKSAEICESAWNTTVGYNYYREAFKYNRGADIRLNWGNVDDYRPDENIRSTFVDEADNLVALLKLAFGLDSDDVPFETRHKMCDMIMEFNARAAEAKSYKRMVSTTTNGYGAVTNRREYWEVDRLLTDSSKENRYKQNRELDEKFIELCKKYSSSCNDIKRLDQLGRYFLTRTHEGESDGEYALIFYEAIITKEPKCVSAYFGKAFAMTTPDVDDGDAITQMNDIAKANLKPFDSDKNNVEFYLSSSFCYSTLLGNAARDCNYTVVKYLIDLGADVNLADHDGWTPLYHIASHKLDENSLDEARQIARLLLDLGAKANITLNGVSLYNESTDREIAGMIKEKYPNLQRGISADKITKNINRAENIKKALLAIALGVSIAVAAICIALLFM